MDNINIKRIRVFLIATFAISWFTAAVIYFTGGFENSPIIFEDANISLAYVLLGTIFMWSPAIANILARVITKEGFNDLGVQFNFKKQWRYLAIAWIITPLCVLLGTGLFFLLFPSYFDGELIAIASQLDLSQVEDTAATLNQIVIYQLIMAVLVSPLLNAVSVFGGEFGWRAYLFPKLAPLGIKKAVIFQGLISGVWYWPLIVMGYNYGLDYTGAPWLGMLAVVWFALIFGVFQTWLTFKTNNFWSAVVAHAALNGIASIGLLFLMKEPVLLIGPFPTGIIGSIPLLVLAVFLLLFGFKEEGSEFTITAGRKTPVKK